MIVAGWGSWRQAVSAAPLWVVLCLQLPRVLSRTQIRERGILYGGEPFRWNGIQGYRWEPSDGVEPAVRVELAGWSEGQPLRLPISEERTNEVDNALRRFLAK